MNGILLKGASGLEYFHTPYPFQGVRSHTDPTNYAFAYLDDRERWCIVYVGETESLFHRLRGHSQWPAARRLGCTHVLVNLNPSGQAARRAQEQDLIARYQPVLNTQHLKPSRPRVKRMGYYPSGWG